MHAPEGCSSIARAEGQLLFFTDGRTVWNKQHQATENGTDIGGDCAGYGHLSSITQSSIIIPHPSKENLYYILTTDCGEDNYAHGFRYSLVDISLLSEIGAVIVKNQLLFASSTKKLAAVYHSDGKSAWVVGHQLHDNIFNAYLISPEGLNTASIVSTTGQVHVSGRYYMKFYPDGKQLISLPDNDFSSTDKQPELFDFDASSGKLTSKFVCTFSSYEPYYGGSFSPNGQVVYFAVTNWYGGIRLHHYNLQAPIPTDIIASRYLIENNQKAAIIYTTVKLIAL